MPIPTNTAVQSVLNQHEQTLQQHILKRWGPCPNDLPSRIDMSFLQERPYSSVSNCTYVWFIIFLSNWFTVCCLFDTYGLFFFQVSGPKHGLLHVYGRAVLLQLSAGEDVLLIREG